MGKLQNFCEGGSCRNSHDSAGWKQDGNVSTGVEVTTEKLEYSWPKKPKISYR